jgi:hypothetical protein
VGRRLFFGYEEKIMKALHRILHGRGKQADHLSVRSLGKLTILLVLLASTTLGAVPGWSGPQAPEAPDAWDIYRVDAPDYFKSLTDRTMRFKSDGTACMAYGGDNLYYSCFDEETDTWTTELVDGSEPVPEIVGSHASLALNDQDKPYISYYDEANGDLKLAYKDPFDTWQHLVVDQSVLRMSPSPEGEISADFQSDAYTLPIYPMIFNAPSDGDPFDFGEQPGVGKYTSIAIDHLNGIHISYYDDYTVTNSGRLKYAYWDGWSAPQISVVQSYHDQGDVGLWSSIAVDGDRVAHIGYMSEKYDDLMYASGRSGGAWTIEQVDTSAVGPYTSIALDGYGRAHISYFDFGTRSLKHAYRRGRNDWVGSTVDSSDNTGYFTSIAIGNNNRVHISYYDAAGKMLKHATTPFGDWDSWTIATAASNGDAGYFSSIALWDGDPAIFNYNLTTGHLQYTRWNPTTRRWETTALTEHYIADVGLATSLVLTSVGAPHISYMDDHRDYLKYAQSLSLDWQTSFVTRDVRAGAWSSIDMLNDFQPVIAFYDLTNRELDLAIWEVNRWKFQNVDTEGDVGAYVSLKIDSQGNFHISYYDATLLRLKYAFKEKGASTWDIRVLDSGGVGKFSSIALDPLDRPYISYFDARNERIKVTFRSATDTWVKVSIATVGDPNDDVQVEEAYTSIDVLNYLTDIHVSYYNETLGDLEYTYFQGGVWNPETVDSMGDVGKYNSLAVDPTAPNARHICYYDETEGDLEYAKWDGVGWLYETVDWEGDVGRFCSIDLNEMGEPAISYYDDSRHDLKYATGFPLPDVQIHHVFLPLTMR